MIATTIINSINVKPCWTRFIFLNSLKRKRLDLPVGLRPADLTNIVSKRYSFRPTADWLKPILERRSLRGAEAASVPPDFRAICPAKPRIRSQIETGSNDWLTQPGAEFQQDVLKFSTRIRF
jgi:hypothetical protein